MKIFSSQMDQDPGSSTVHQPRLPSGDELKQLTTTKATYLDVTISVSSDRFDGNTMFCCGNSLEVRRSEDKWFPTQGEAIANERREIDRRKGIVRPMEEKRNRWGRSTQALLC